MIYRLPVGQVPQFWEHIKFVALQTDFVPTEGVQIYCNNLLIDLLAGNKLILIMLDQSKQLQLLAILSFHVSKITGEKTVKIDNFYGWTGTSKEEKIGFFQAVQKLGRVNECANVVADTYNHKLWDLATVFTPIRESKSFVFPIE